MNKYEKSYFILEDYDNQYISQVEIALENIKELVEQATELQAQNQHGNIDNLPFCSICHNVLLDHGCNYCDDCGQKLGWEKIDEIR